MYLPAALKSTTRLPDDHGSRPKAVRYRRARAPLRLIAGTVGGFQGQGVTFTPITYLRAAAAPGAKMALPRSPEFSALGYALVD
jgi:quercetin 2,3-dioxygenase